MTNAGLESLKKTVVDEAVLNHFAAEGHSNLDRTMLECCLHFEWEAKFETREVVGVYASPRVVIWVKCESWQQGPATSTFPAYERFLGSPGIEFCALSRQYRLYPGMVDNFEKYQDADVVFRAVTGDPGNEWGVELGGPRRRLEKGKNVSIVRTEGDE